MMRDERSVVLSEIADRRSQTNRQTDRHTNAG